MSTSTRDQRVAIYAYNAQMVDGMTTNGYAKVASTAGDGAWWSRKEPVSAREASVAMQMQHQVDWVFAFSDEVTGLTTDGVLRDVQSGELFKITGFYRSREAREFVVHAISASDEVYDAVTD